MKTYCNLIQAHFESIILFPKQVSRLRWYADCALIDTTKRIHFLLILPGATADDTRSRLEELHIVLPNFARFFIKANMLQCNVIR